MSRSSSFASPPRGPADRRSDARTRVGNTNRDFTPIFGRAHTWPCRASFPGRRICITTGSPAPTHTDAHHTGQHFHIHPRVGYSAPQIQQEKRRRARTASHSLSTYAPCWRCPTLRFPSESGSCRRRCGPIWSRRGSTGDLALAESIRLTLAGRPDWQWTGLRRVYASSEVAAACLGAPPTWLGKTLSPSVSRLARRCRPTLRSLHRQGAAPADVPDRFADSSHDGLGRGPVVVLVQVHAPGPTHDVRVNSSDIVREFKAFTNSPAERSAVPCLQRRTWPANSNKNRLDR